MGQPFISGLRSSRKKLCSPLDDGPARLTHRRRRR